MSKGIVDKALANPIQLAIGVGIVAGVVYFLGRIVIKQTAEVARGVVSGNNALTSGTPYAGAGVLGTLGAAVNEASGGTLQSIGESLGGFVFDLFHKEYDPNDGLQTGAKTVSDGAKATDALWGRIGSVSLRSQ
jgi:hypothetical protein